MKKNKSLQNDVRDLNETENVLSGNDFFVQDRSGIVQY